MLLGKPTFHLEKLSNIVKITIKISIVIILSVALEFKIELMKLNLSKNGRTYEQASSKWYLIDNLT